MEREFGALKGLMGVNGLTGGDIMPDIGIGKKDKSSCSDIPLILGSCGTGCINGCGDGCMSGCRASNHTGSHSG